MLILKLDPDTGSPVITPEENLDDFLRGLEQVFLLHGLKFRVSKDFLAAVMAQNAALQLDEGELFEVMVHIVVRRFFPDRIADIIDKNSEALRQGYLNERQFEMMLPEVFAAWATFLDESGEKWNEANREWCICAAREELLPYDDGTMVFPSLRYPGVELLPFNLKGLEKLDDGSSRVRTVLSSDVPDKLADGSLLFVELFAGDDGNLRGRLHLLQPREAS